MATPLTVNVPSTFGALLLGGLFASLLSGAVTLQTIVYFKLYSHDHARTKALVAIIWLLDVLHTSFIWSGLWYYLIVKFGSDESIDFIYWALSCTVAVTGILTFIIHCFFSHRIFMLSRGNWLLVAPIFFLALCRLVSSTVTTAEMILNITFHNFKAKFHWVFTLGLALSSTIDVIITICLFVLLKTNRTSDFDLNAVIDTLILYAFETGSLTAAGTIVSMVCWLTMNDNLIFMGLHFVIAKLYANSILVTLDTRRSLRRSRSTSAVLTRENTAYQGRRKSMLSRVQLASKDSINAFFPPIRSPKVTINIERSIHCEDDK